MISLLIIYKVGKYNQVADALSRSYESEEEEILYSNKAEAVKRSMLALSAPVHSLIEEIKKYNINSDQIRELIQKINSENLQAQGHIVRNGLILYKGRILLIQGSVMTNKVIREFHDSYVGRHSRIDRTFNRISKKICGQE